MKRLHSQQFPIKLDKAVRVTVPRPKKSRSRSEKAKEEEILLIHGIEVNREAFVKFDVIINDKDETVIRPIHSEFAGSFVHMPRMHKEGAANIKTCLRLGITHLLEDLGAEEDDGIMVTFVPKQGHGDVTIGGAKIEFDS